MKIQSILIFLFFTVFTGVSCDSNSEKKIPGDVVFNPASADNPTDKEGLPEITFETTEHDFGKVIRGEIVVYSFKFENTGNSELLISDVSASCGCTATDYPRDPLKPGEKGTVKVTFNSNNRRGFQHKPVTVATNTQPSKTTLVIKAMVIVPEEE